MNPFRVAYVVPLAMLAAVAAGCAGGETADEAGSTQPEVTADLVELDGVGIDVRRDPG